MSYSIFLRKLSKSKLILKAIKYGLVSVGIYFGVFLSLYLFVDVFSYNAAYVFPAIYFFAYFFDYLLNLKFVFNSSHNRARFFFYVSYLIVFYALNNLTFYLLFKIFDFNHMASAALVVLFLFPLRFLVQNLIFKKNEGNDMKDFTNKSLTVDELWEFCNEEYENSNFIVKKLISRFFLTIGSVIKEWDASETILELGCGSGKSSAELFRFAGCRHFEASEYDERFVQKLNTLELPYKIQQESVYELNRSDKSVDHIIMLEVLEHLEHPSQALSEIFRVAKKSVILSVPHEPIWCMANFFRGKYLSRLGNTPGHINHWTYFSFKRLLSNYGEVVFIKTKFPWLIAEVKVIDISPSL